MKFLAKFFTVFSLLFGCWVLAANAHPHVFIESNLEIFRDDNGKAAELRHVWRFDAVFSSSIVVDFDKNTNNALEVEELEAIATTIKTNLKEYDYFTAVKLGNEEVELDLPKLFFADYQDGQLILIVVMTLKTPIDIVGKQFSVSVSDPSYYVAVEFSDKNSIEVTGGGGKCKSSIEVPDFDTLYSQNPEVFENDFQGSDDSEIFNSDDYLTWVHFDCD